MKICENCRAELNDDAIFCSICGTKVSETKLPEEKTNETEQIKTQASVGETNKPEKSKKNALIIVGVIAAVLVIALLIGVLVKPQTPVAETITIPDIEDIDEMSAKNLISSNGLIPKVEYIYDDYTDEGKVIKTSPQIGSKVEKNTKVTIYVSKGHSYIKSTRSTITWYDISSADDEWHFYNPYISNGVLYIECYSVTFGTAMQWKDQYNKGELFGEASINDTFDKTVPISAKYEKQSWKANEEQSFTLEIPLGDLNVSKPTDIHIELVAMVNSQQKNVKVSFTMTWPK